MTDPSRMLESPAPSEGGEDMADEPQHPTRLPKGNAVHYAGGVFLNVDWSERGAYMQRKHGLTSAVADDALADPNRVVIDPDYNSLTGKSIRIIGFSTLADDVITVIVLEHQGVEYGVNGWIANQKDRRLYEGEAEGEIDEHQD